MKMKSLTAIILSLFLVINLGFAQQSPDEITDTTTNVPPNVTESSPIPSEVITTESDAISATDVSPRDSKSIKESDENTNVESKKQEAEPKVFIIHHHYRDPVDFQFSGHLQKVSSNNIDLSPQFNYPNYHFGQPSPVESAQPQEESSQTNQRFDPLGQFTDGQKKRQFFQDLLMNQLGKFEAEFEPMIENEDNITEKNDMEEVLGAVKELKRIIENHQIFNISEVMDDWKEGRLKPQSSVDNHQTNKPIPPMPKVHHHYYHRPRPQMISTGPSQGELTLQVPPPMTRTYLLVPQSRIIQPEFVPHFHPHTIPGTFTVPQIQSFRDSSSMMAAPSMQSPMMIYRRRMSQPSLYYNPTTSRTPYSGGLLGRSVSGSNTATSSLESTASSVTLTTSNVNDDDNSNDDIRQGSMVVEENNPKEIELQK